MGGRTRLGLAAAVVVIAAIAVPTGAALAATGRPAVGGQNPVPTANPAPTANPVPTANPTSNPTTVPTAPTATATVPVPTPGPTPAELAAQAAAAAAAKAAADKAAKLAAEQAKAQAEAQRKAAEAAARLAQQTARAAAAGSEVWAKHGKPSKLVIIHQTSIDTFSGGQLVQHLQRSGVNLTIAALDSALPAGWLTIDGGKAQLAAAVVMTQGSGLVVSGVDTLALVGGKDVPDAAFVYTGTGRLQLRGVTVTSVDPDSGQAVAGDAVGRPHITVASGGRFDASDATISSLGTAVGDDGGGDAAVAFRKGSTGTIQHTTFTRNSIGLSLSKSQGVRLDDVTVNQSDADGIVLFADTGTTMQGVHADSNGGMGVAVSGDGNTAREITGISATLNRNYGVAVTGQTNAEVHDISTSKNRSGGLELNRMTGAKVHDITTVDEPQGVFVHGYSKEVTLDKLTVTRGRVGVHIDKSTTGLHVTNSTVDGPQVGFSIGGQISDLSGVTISNAGAALKFERLAAGLTLTGIVVHGGEDGLVLAPDSKGVVIKDLATDGVSNTAVRDLSDGLQMTGGQIRGGRTGVSVEGAATITGTTIGLATTGMRVRTPKTVAITGITIDAVSLGLDVSQSGAVTLRNSSVHALESLRGTLLAFENNDLSLPSLNLLGAIGVPLLLLAVSLELAHVLRSRRAHRTGAGGGGRRLAPPPLLVGAR